MVRVQAAGGVQEGETHQQLRPGDADEGRNVHINSLVLFELLTVREQFFLAYGELKTSEIPS